VELTWHWGEDVGTVGQVVGAVELYSAVLIHSPDCDCRQTKKDTFITLTHMRYFATTIEHTVSQGKCKRDL